MSNILNYSGPNKYYFYSRFIFLCICSQQSDFKRLTQVCKGHETILMFLIDNYDHIAQFSFYDLSLLCKARAAYIGLREYNKIYFFCLILDRYLGCFNKQYYCVLSSTCPLVNKYIHAAYVLEIELPGQRTFECLDLV